MAIKKKTLGEALATAYTSIPKVTLTNNGLLTSDLFIRRMQSVHLNQGRIYKIAHFSKSWASFHMSAINAGKKQEIIDIFIVAKDINLSYINPEAYGKSSSNLVLKRDSQRNIYVQAPMSQDFALLLEDHSGGTLIPITEISEFPNDAIDMTVYEI